LNCDWNGKAIRTDNEYTFIVYRYAPYVRESRPTCREQDDQYVTFGRRGQETGPRFRRVPGEPKNGRQLVYCMLLFVSNLLFIIIKNELIRFVGIRLGCNVRAVLIDFACVFNVFERYSVRGLGNEPRPTGFGTRNLCERRSPKPNRVTLV